MVIPIVPFLFSNFVRSKHVGWFLLSLSTSYPLDARAAGPCSFFFLFFFLTHTIGGVTQIDLSEGDGTKRKKKHSDTPPGVLRPPFLCAPFDLSIYISQGYLRAMFFLSLDRSRILDRKKISENIENHP